MLTDMPFFENPSSTHCWQASMKMILAHAFPEREYSWEELDKLTNKHEGKWTYFMAGCLNMQKLGFDVEIIGSESDLELFGRDIVKYIQKTEPNTAEISIKMTDIPTTQVYAKQYADAVKNGDIIKHIKKVNVNDYIDHLQKGHYIIQWVNAQLLGDKDKYSGHFVAITAAEKGKITFHDSAHHANREMDEAKFINACFNGDDAPGTFIFIKN